MTLRVVRESVTIDLADGCAQDHCLKMAWELRHQLEPSYAKGAAVMPLTGTFKQFRGRHRTARRRALHALAHGYTAGLIDREDHVDDIFEINTSAESRQGRPMANAYLEAPRYGPNPKVCDRHHVYTYGVHSAAGPLVGYLWLYRSGGLALVSSILGHAYHLPKNVMYLLYLHMLDHQWPLGGTVMYNLWNSGTDGLRFFKERVGLYESDVEWALT